MAYRIYSNQIDDYHSFYIRGMGEKASSVRLALMRTLSKINKPVPLSEIKEKMNHHDESSIQRALEALVKIKLVKRILLDPKKNLYEINLDRRHHHHIVCNSCGLIEDIEFVKTKDKCSLLPHSKIPKTFSTVTDHSLEFFGICKSCTRR